MLYVEPSARGLGLGRRLVDETIRIYQAAGFKLVKEERHNEFGHDVNGQFWEMVL